MAGGKSRRSLRWPQAAACVLVCVAAAVVTEHHFVERSLSGVKLRKCGDDAAKRNRSDDASASRLRGGGGDGGAASDEPPSSFASLAAKFDTYFRRYSLLAPSAVWERPTDECGGAPDFAKYFRQDPARRSANREDNIIYETFFKDKNGNMSGGSGAGNYVELGAFNGEREANTRFFDVCLGWKGLLIEGNPRIFPQLETTRPGAFRLHFAPSCNATEARRNGTVMFHDYVFTNAGLAGHANAYKDGRTVPVPCGPLTPVLLDIFDGRSIDFFSLDVEGAEPLVLNTIDFKAVRINVIMIEVQNAFCKTKCEARDKVRAMMKKAGYKRYSGVVPKSDLFIHPEAKFQISIPESAR